MTASEPKLTPERLREIAESHTAGPWLVSNRDGRFVEIWSDLADRAVCRVWIGGWRDEALNVRNRKQEEANVRLILLAPELLTTVIGRDAVIKQLVEALRHEMRHDFGNCRDQRDNDMCASCDALAAAEALERE